MPKFPDISEYYTGELAIHEELNWIKVGHKHFIDFVLAAVDKYELYKIAEFGCATGHVAAGLPRCVDYVGIDKNPWFIEKARERCPDLQFILGDVRAINTTGYDLSMAWAFIKHFALDEVDDIIRKIVSTAAYSIFGMQFLKCDEDVADDGLGYNHVFITEKRFADVLASVSRKEIHRQQFIEWKHPRADAYDCAVLIGKIP